MRYRRLSYRYTMVVRSGQTLPLGEIWQSDRLRLLVQPSWRPDADTYETATTVEILVDLAAVDEDDLEVQLFERLVLAPGNSPSPMHFRPLRDMVPFPLTAFPLAVGQPRSVRLVVRQSGEDPNKLVPGP